MTRFAVRYLFIAAVCAFAGVIHADTVVAEFDGVSPGQAFHYRFTGPLRIADAGEYTFTRTGGDYDLLGSIGDSFTTFCIEINQPVRVGRVHTYEVVELADAPFPGVGAGNGKGMGDEKAYDIQRLWANYYDDIGNDNVKAAAFQIAIWEILYDQDLSLSRGAFQARYGSADPVRIAQGWLKNLSWDGDLPELAALTSPTAQDQVFALPVSSSAPPAAIPLPASIWAGSALLIGLVVAQRIRRHRAA